MLRRLEVAVMEYRVSLEERGIKSSEEIDKKVALLRKKHEADLGIVDGQWLPNRDGDVKGSDGSRVSGDYITIYYPWGYTHELVILLSFVRL
jgi:U2-associated protein SR140